MGQGEKKGGARHSQMYPFQSLWAVTVEECLGVERSDCSLHAGDGAGPWRSSGACDRGPALAEAAVQHRDHQVAKHIFWYVVHAGWHQAGRRTGWERMSCCVPMSLGTCVPVPGGEQSFSRKSMVILTSLQAVSASFFPFLGNWPEIKSICSWTKGVQLEDKPVSECMWQGLCPPAQAISIILSSPDPFPWPQVWREVLEMEPNLILKLVTPTDRNHTGVSNNYSCAKQAISFSIPGWKGSPLLSNPFSNIYF